MGIGLVTVVGGSPFGLHAVNTTIPVGIAADESDFIVDNFLATGSAEQQVVTVYGVDQRCKVDARTGIALSVWRDELIVATAPCDMGASVFERDIRHDDVTGLIASIETITTCIGIGAHLTIVGVCWHTLREWLEVDYRLQVVAVAGGE